MLAVVDASRKATSRDLVSGDFRTCVTPVAHNEVVGIAYAEGMSGPIHFVVCHAALRILAFRLRRIDLGGRGAFQESQKAQKANVYCAHHTDGVGVNVKKKSRVGKRSRIHVEGERRLKYYLR